MVYAIKTLGEVGRETLFGRLSGSYLETYLENLILFSENVTSSTVARSSGRTYARILKAHSHSQSMSGGGSI